MSAGHCKRCGQEPIRCWCPPPCRHEAEIAALRARAEKVEAQAEDLAGALRLVSRFREACHDHDADMGHPLRPFDDADEWTRVEEIAGSALASYDSGRQMPGEGT